VKAILEPYATWAVATSDYAAPGSAGPPLSFAHKTLRHILQTSIGGEQLRVRFSNVHGTAPLVIDGAHVAAAKGGSEIDTASDRALSVSGAQTFTAPAGTEVWSDAVPMAVSPNASLAISVFVKAETPARTWHPFGMQTHYIGEGDRLSAASIVHETTTAYHWVTGVDVFRREAARVVVVLGDSNIDGFGSTQTPLAGSRTISPDGWRRRGWRSESSTRDSRATASRWTGLSARARRGASRATC
jgi:hypothetical protein